MPYKLPVKDRTIWGSRNSDYLGAGSKPDYLWVPWQAYEQRGLTAKHPVELGCWLKYQGKAAMVTQPSGRIWRYDEILRLAIPSQKLPFTP